MLERGCRPDLATVRRRRRGTGLGERQVPTGGDRRGRGSRRPDPLLHARDDGARRLRGADAALQRARGDDRRDAAVRGVGGDRPVQLPVGARRRSGRSRTGRGQRRDHQAVADRLAQRSPRVRLPRRGRGAARRHQPADRGRRHRRRARSAPRCRRRHVHRVERRGDVDHPRRSARRSRSRRSARWAERTRSSSRPRPMSSSPLPARRAAPSATPVRSARRRRGCSSTPRSPTSSSARLVERAEAIAPMGPLEPGGFLSPVVNTAALDRYATIVDEVRAEGEVLCGGRRLDDGDLAAGNFVAPTVVLAADESRVWSDELFVPLIAVRTVASLDEALGAGQRGAVRAHRRLVQRATTRRSSASSAASRPASCTSTGRPARRPVPGQACSRSAAGSESGTAGKAGGGPYYLQQYLREQSRTVVTQD